LHEYQNKGLTEFAFRKLLILKDAILVVFGEQEPKWAAPKEKRKASSNTPNRVIYKIKYITVVRKVKDNVAGKLGGG